MHTIPYCYLLPVTEAACHNALPEGCMLATVEDVRDRQALSTASSPTVH